MPTPGVTLTVNNQGLGFSVPNTGNQGLEVGWSTSGPGATVLAFADTASVALTYGGGPLVEAASYILACGAPSVLCCRIYDGTIASSFTHTTGTGAGTIAGSGAPMSAYGQATTTGSTGVIVKIGATGGLGAGTFLYSLDGGQTYSVAQTIPSGGAYVIPQTGITLTFAGASFTAADVYTGPITTSVGSLSAVVQSSTTGAGQGAGNVTTTGSVASDAFNVVATIIASGALGAATFQYSFDGGRTTSATTLIPSGGGPVVIGNGIQLTFAATGGTGGTANFVAGDSYSFTTTGPSYSTTDVANVCGNIGGSPQNWGWLHLIGRAATPTAAATMASTIDSQMTNFAAINRYCFGIVECPLDSVGVSIDSALVTAFASFASDRTMVCAGDANVNSIVQGTQVSRSCAWPVAGRCATVPIGHDLGEYDDNPLKGVAAISRDEAATPNLDAAGFTTLRRFRNKPGFYIFNGRMMTTSTSSFQFAQYRRVMDVASTDAVAALLTFVNKSVRVNPTTGVIFEQDARKIEKYVTAAIAKDTTQTGNAEAINVQVSRTHNILVDSTLPVTIGIVPLGYSKYINTTIGFVNPALAVQ